jgi:imidazolonepropionase
VLLPGAFYTLQETRKPPVQLLRDHKVPIAIATDCNPGTSPLLNPQLAMNMACTLFGLTPEEVIAGMTVNAARAHGLGVRLHAEQLSNQNGAELAARYKALSADHLEHLDVSGAKAMARAGTVAVLLPGAFYTLQETRKPPVQLLRDHKVPIAIATDCNPGTSPLLNPQLAMNMACTLFGLTPEEVIAGMTVNAARALGLASQIGSIAAGKAADLAVWRIAEPAELGDWVGLKPERRIFAGMDS